MIIGTTKELKNHEYRVGLTPDSVSAFISAGHTVYVETGAGVGVMNRMSKAFGKGESQWKNFYRLC